MRVKQTFDDATIALLRNKQFCKAVAKEQSLEDYYLERAAAEIKNASELQEQVNELKEEVERLKEEVKQKSKPLEQRVEELEQDVEQLRNGLRETRRVTSMWKPMK